MTKISMFGVTIDALDMRGTVDRIVGWLESDTTPCQYVVTPNVDHVVMLQTNDRLRAAYDEASLVLADGFPLVVAARLLGRPLPERVAGSELVPALFDRLASRQESTRVFLLGALPGVAVKAAREIDRNWPHLNVVGTYSPPFGFEHDEEECERILTQLNDSNAEIVVFGVGAPKQELWAHRFHDRISAKALFCVGATIDFLAGEKSQAPVWMRRTGLEWIHRCASEPRRLLGRYARGAIVFPQILFREWSRSRG